MPRERDDTSAQKLMPYYYTKYTVSEIISQIPSQAHLEQHHNLGITLNVYKVDTSAFKGNQTMTAEIYHRDYASVYAPEIFHRLISRIS